MQAFPSNPARKPLDLMAALMYPFQDQGWVQSTVAPGVFYMVMMAVGVIYQLIMSLVVGAVGMMLEGVGYAEESSEFNLVIGIFSLPFLLIGMVLSIVQAAIPQGFGWHMLGEIKRHGYHALMPSWLERWKSFFWDGLKLLLFILMVNWGLILIFAIPAVLVIFFVGQSGGSNPIVMLLLLGLAVVMVACIWGAMPFVLGAWVHKAETRSFWQLFNLSAMLRITLPRYGRIWLGFIYMLVVLLLYLIGTLVLCLTCVGVLLIPFLWVGPYMVTGYHILAQAFEIGDEAEHQQTSGLPPLP